MKKQGKLTHKEAVKKALEELGGRARLGDIYPRAIPQVYYKPGSDIKATLRRLIQTTPELFRKVEGMKGWWELVSYQEELAEKDRRIAELTREQITKDEIVRGFSDLETLAERIYARNMMQLMFHEKSAWKDALKEMKKAGYFKEVQPPIVLDHPQFESLYEIKGNKNVTVGK